jgi:hypothetical protein
MRIRRRVIFALIACAAVLLSIEAVVRLAERSRTRRDVAPVSPPVDADSVLSFQRTDREILIPSDLPDPVRWTFDNLDRPGQLVRVEKPAGQLRVVILGGSQAGALGLSDGASYARLLENFLRERHPNRDIQVINLAMTGWAAAQHAFLAETLFPRLKPDLVLAIFGHNERLDVKALTAAGRSPPELLAVSKALQRNSALARLLKPTRDAVPSAPGRPLPEWNRDPAWDSYWLARLERSAKRIAVAARRNGARLVVFFPPSNLLYDQPREWWWAGETDQDRRVIRARHWLRYGRPDEALALLGQYHQEKNDLASALTLGLAAHEAGRSDLAREPLRQAARGLDSELQIADDRYAYLMIRALLGAGEEARARSMLDGWRQQPGSRPRRDALLGAALLAAGRPADARPLLAAARDEDPEAIRADAAVRATLRHVAEQQKVPFRDLDAALAATCPDALCGWDVFFDYCHLTPIGHLRVAGLLLPVVEKELRLAGPPADPAPNRERELRAALQGRDRDFPELTRWLGVCDEMWQLSEERLDDHTCRPPFDESDPTALCFAGNRELQGAVLVRNVESAAHYYQRAGELNPSFSAGEENLRYLRSFTALDTLP